MSVVNYTFIGGIIACLAYPFFLIVEREPAFYLTLCAGVAIIGFSCRRLHKLKEIELREIGHVLKFIGTMHAGYFGMWTWDYIYPDFTFFVSGIIFMITIILCLIILWAISAHSAQSPE